jgi:hypothetical protein
MMVLGSAAYRPNIASGNVDITPAPLIAFRNPRLFTPSPIVIHSSRFSYGIEKHLPAPPSA